MPKPLRTVLWLTGGVLLIGIAAAMLVPTIRRDVAGSMTSLATSPDNVSVSRMALITARVQLGVDLNIAESDIGYRTETLKSLGNGRFSVTLLANGRPFSCAGDTVEMDCGKGPMKALPASTSSGESGDATARGCRYIYLTTSDKRLGDLTVKDAEMVDFCRALSLYH